MKKVETECSKPLGFNESFVEQDNSLSCAFLETKHMFQKLKRVKSKSDKTLRKKLQSSQKKKTRQI
jgi:hypothetical protein